jgi:hypothetical protein
MGEESFPFRKTMMYFVFTLLRLPQTLQRLEQHRFDRPNSQGLRQLTYVKKSDKTTRRSQSTRQLGKLLCDVATGEVLDVYDDGKDAAASALGRKGGNARARVLTGEQRRHIAHLAAQASGLSHS